MSGSGGRSDKVGGRRADAVTQWQRECGHRASTPGVRRAFGPHGQADAVGVGHVGADKPLPVAAQLQADVFLLLTDVEGVFRDYHDKSSLIGELSFDEATEMIRNGVVDGGMIPKLQACMGALEKGARLARVVDGRRPHCIVESLQPGNVAGTAVVKHKG